MPPFSEADRILEQDIHEICCYDTFELEAPLNRFSDTMLNQHLYSMCKKGKLEKLDVMRKLLCFFVRRYCKELEPKVNEYLQVKKLTMDNWIKAVKSKRRGDIVCVFFLSMITGNHMFIHLKNDRIWCTLKAVPLHHYELIERCEIHLVYMGFGIFLQLKKQQTPIVYTHEYLEQSPVTIPRRDPCFTLWKKQNPKTYHHGPVPPQQQEAPRNCLESN